MKSLALLTALSLSLTVSAEDYTVVKGDTLSEITATQLGAPIYGEQGNLTKLLDVNREITNPNLILVDQKIVIPFQDEVNVQLASSLKNKLTGNVIPNLNKRSKWDFSLDANLFTTTLGIQSNKNKQSQTTNSGLSYGAKGNLYYEANDNFQGRLELGVEKVKYGNRNISLNQDASALSSAILGGEYLYKSQILLGFYAGVKERLLATDLTENLLTIQRKAIGQVGLGTAFVLSESGKNKMALELNGSLLLENSGRDFGAKISIIRSRTTISPFLNYTTLDTTAGQQDDLATGLNFSYQL